MANTTNTASSMAPILKESYSDSKKKKKKESKNKKFSKIMSKIKPDCCCGK